MIVHIFRPTTVPFIFHSLTYSYPTLGPLNVLQHAIGRFGQTYCADNSPLTIEVFQPYIVSYGILELQPVTQMLSTECILPRVNLPLSADYFPFAHSFTLYNNSQLST